MTDNGFGAGLPPEVDNGPKWDFFRPFLADVALKPSPEDIIAEAHAQALDLLRLRASTRLFRLASGHEIRTKLTFPVSNTAHQIPGVIVMRIDDSVGEPSQHEWSSLVAVFNATPLPARLAVPGAGSSARAASGAGPRPVAGGRQGRPGGRRMGPGAGPQLRRLRPPLVAASALRAATFAAMSWPVRIVSVGSLHPVAAGHLH